MQECPSERGRTKMACHGCARHEQGSAWKADMKTCPDCNGDGVIDKGTDDEKQCPTCGGSGFVPDDNDDKNNERQEQRGSNKNFVSYRPRSTWQQAVERATGLESQHIAAAVDPRRDGAKPR
jgi:DnaJ-class molecular chaperone